MKSLILTIMILVAAAVGAILYVAENIQVSIEQGASMAFRPIKHGLKSYQIRRDVPYGEYTYDVYFPEKALKSFEAPKLPAELTQISNILGTVARSFGYTTGKKFPVLVFLHGGFFSGGNKKNYAHICGFAVRQGFICAIPELPHLPGRIKQAFSGDKHRSKFDPQAHLRQLGIFTAILKKRLENMADIDNFHYIAHGSGGYLALHTAQTEKSIQTIVLLNAMINLGDTNDEFKKNYPLLQMEQDTPDALLAKFSFKNPQIKIMSVISEHDYPFIARQNKFFLANFSRGASPTTLEKESHFSIVFKLGRRNHASTKLISDFWQENVKSAARHR